jgi:hypothetical protein
VLNAGFPVLAVAVEVRPSICAIWLAHAHPTTCARVGEARTYDVLSPVLPLVGPNGLRNPASVNVVLHVRGEICSLNENRIGSEGALVLAGALVKNTTLQSLAYVPLASVLMVLWRVRMLFARPLRVRVDCVDFPVGIATSLVTEALRTASLPMPCGSFVLLGMCGVAPTRWVTRHQPNHTRVGGWDTFLPLALQPTPLNRSLTARLAEP